MKRDFSQTVSVSILLYGCTTWTLITPLEKKLEGNNTRMLAIRSFEQILEVVSHKTATLEPLILQTIQVRQTRHVDHCWKSKDELKNDVLL